MIANRLLANQTKQWLFGHNLITTWRDCFRYVRFQWFGKSNKLPIELSKISKLDLKSKSVKKPFSLWSRIRDLTFKRLSHQSSSLLAGRWSRHGQLLGFALVGVQLNQLLPSEEDHDWQRFQRTMQNIHTRNFEDESMKQKLNQIDMAQLKINRFLDKGCDAAIYEANVKQNLNVDRQLAVKLLFNYDISSNANEIFQQMNKELIPFVGTFGPAIKVKAKQMSRPHPNIVPIYSAFVDKIPQLPDNGHQIESALPLSMNSNGLGRNLTMFVVMKQFECNLNQYLTANVISTQESSCLFAQLLSGVNFLNEQGIAHRDLKSNNLLIERTSESGFPLLVISDFGCSYDSLLLYYPNEEICKGGNRSLMAPEIVNAKPSLFTFLNYSKADLWACGAIAYEMFGELNPFYRKENGKMLNSANYESNQLPIGKHIPLTTQKLILNILEINPNLRPSCRQACTIALLIALYDEWYLTLIQKLVHNHSNVKELQSFVRRQLFQTLMKSSVKTNLTMKRLEVQLLSELNVNDVISALKYFT